MSDTTERNHLKMSLPPLLSTKNYKRSLNYLDLGRELTENMRKTKLSLQNQHLWLFELSASSTLS